MTDQVSNMRREGQSAVQYYPKFVCVFRKHLQGYTAAQSSQDLVSGDELPCTMSPPSMTSLSDVLGSAQEHECLREEREDEDE